MPRASLHSRLAVLALGSLAAGGGLRAQSIQLPASDPVGIARSGAGVAYGRSLEAATLNPALLVTLQEPMSAYLSVGREYQSAQETLSSNGVSLYSVDRGRTLPGFGFAWARSTSFSLGLKADASFMRHAEFGADAPSRFQGNRLALSARRLEAQAAWALKPDFSVGLGFGVTRVSFENGTFVRAVVPQDPSQPAGAGNPAVALAETALSSEAHKVLPSFTLGARWALNPRWTLGFTYESALRGDLDLTAGRQHYPLRTLGTDGYGPAPLGSEARSQDLMSRSTVSAGSGRLVLPERATLGLRQRVNPFFTWEGDLRWFGGGLRVPGMPVLNTPGGPVTAASQLPEGHRSLGLSLTGEVALGKSWTLRTGAALDQARVDDADIEPLLGGARTSAFSVGFGYRIWGGEMNVGYQFRQSQDAVTSRLDGVWDQGGFRGTGTPARVEGMGHLFSIGFRRSF